MYPRALMRGNPPSITYTRLVQNLLSLKSSLTIAISIITFSRKDNRKRGKVCISHDRAPFPNQTTPATIAPPTPRLPLITPPKVISTPLRLFPFCVAPARRRRNYSQCVERKIFSPVHSPLFFPSYIVANPTVLVIPPPSIC